ncbi:hypothetical protein SteCoe_8133 [Stentor coeruleus]|uniref:RAP domain-containing protein n=1 Tax=Stentor coeruleus TaxID=5963 RepID=A0A1R2CL22_9CILI|nr:hypothetical protein SteCoe_8133 [Stentor coeruleus]
MLAFLTKSRCVFRSYSKSDNLRTAFFKSNMLTPQELADAGKLVSQLNIIELRVHYGKEEVFKNYIFNLTSKLYLMKSEDMISLMVSLIKNPEFRDHKNSYGLWPAMCRALNARSESLSLEHIIDVIHSVCFMRIGVSMTLELVNSIKNHIENFTSSDFASLPLNKYNSLLWSIGIKKIGSERLYRTIFDSFMQHKDFEHLSYDNLALHYYLFSTNTNIAKMKEITMPLEIILTKALLDDAPKSFNEFIDIVYYLIEAKHTSKENLELIYEKTYQKFKENPLNSSIIMRLVNNDVEWSPKITEYIVESIKKSLNLFNITELATIYMCSFFENQNELKLKVLDEMKYKNISGSMLSFARFEKLLNNIFLTKDYAKDFWPIFHKYCVRILEEPLISDNLLLKIMSWLMHLKINSQDCINLFIKRILTEKRLPYYHSRDLMNLAIIVANYEPLATKEFMRIVDNKLFDSSHNMEYTEISRSLYFFTHINRLGFETNELLVKRLLDRDTTNQEPDEFSLACQAAVMNNSIDFCKKSITFARILMGFKDINENNLKIGEILRKPGNQFSMPLQVVIRLGWMMTFMNIKDSRIFNTGLYQKFEQFTYDDSWFNNYLSIRTHYLDAHHMYLLMQILAINAYERPESIELLKRFNEKMLPKVEEYTYNLVSEEKLGIYKQIAELARNNDLAVDEQSSVIFGNVVKLKIEGRPVFYYLGENYNFQSQNFVSALNDTNLIGIYKMREKMLKALKIETIELYHGDWTQRKEEDKVAFLKSLKTT